MLNGLVIPQAIGEELVIRESELWSFLREGMVLLVGIKMDLSSIDDNLSGISHL